MTSSASSGCCKPCVCTPSVAPGCISELCAPRPCFFNGQLVTADDLNAIMTYWRAKTAMLARFVGGWGVFGGLRVQAAPGVAVRPLEPGNNLEGVPIILQGTTINVTAGVAVDAVGNILTACGPMIVDLERLAGAVPTATQSKTCNDWFEQYGGLGLCTGATQNVSAREYWLVAQYKEQLTRPAPKFSGGGACDPAPSCDMSRALEEVELRLVRSIPKYYLATGCLGTDGTTEIDDVLPPEIAAQFAQDTFLSGHTARVGDDMSYATMAAVLDYVGSTVGSLCCLQPAIVLARVLLTSDPGPLKQDLQSVPIYAIIQPAQPARRFATSAAMLSHMVTQLFTTMPSDAGLTLGREGDATLGMATLPSGSGATLYIKGQDTEGEDANGGNVMSRAGAPNGQYVVTSPQQESVITVSSRQNEMGQFEATLGVFGAEPVNRQTVYYTGEESQAVLDLIQALHRTGMINAIGPG